MANQYFLNVFLNQGTRITNTKNKDGQPNGISLDDGAGSTVVLFPWAGTVENVTLIDEWVDALQVVRTVMLQKAADGTSDV